MVEHDHRDSKSRVNVVLGVKRFEHGASTLTGIELMHRIRKGQLCECGPERYRRARCLECRTLDMAKQPTNGLPFVSTISLHQNPFEARQKKWAASIHPSSPFRVSRVTVV
jgi:hypothetical protein